MKQKIRVLVVDDSAFMRKLIVEIIESDPEFKVIETAGNGLEAIQLVEKHKPDVVTLDIELPEIDGLAVLVYIMNEFPTPVVMITGFSSFLGEETIKALEYGAVSFVRKPSGPISRNLDEMKKELLEQLRIAARVDVRKLAPIVTEMFKESEVKAKLTATDKIVAIASSSGGPRALSQVIPKLPGTLNAGVVLVQHIPIEFVPPLAGRLDRESQLEVKAAEDMEPIQKGKILVMPSTRHCRIELTMKKKEVIRLIPFSAEEKSRFCMADPLMVSLASVYGKNAIGVVLTGMGSDGTEGLRAIRKNGGYTMAEDKSTCVVYGMPKSAFEAGVVDKMVPLDRIAEEIVRAVRRM